MDDKETNEETFDIDAEIEYKRIAADLVRTLLDNHSGDWDHEETARAFVTLYEAVRDS